MAATDRARAVLAGRLLALTLWAAGSLSAAAEPRGQPILFRRVEVPGRLTTTETVEGARLTYGGDVRIGDLTGDGQVDFVVFRNVPNTTKPSYLAAFAIDGNILWESGSGGGQPVRPGPVAMHDFDGDGRAEVLCFFVDGSEAPGDSLADVVLQLRDGATGRVLRQSAPGELRAQRGDGPNWVHQRLLACNLRGTDSPRDFVVKVGDKLFAYDEALRPLWTYRIRWNAYGRCGAYIPAVGDIDGDGRDEVNGGYFLLDAHGKPLWENPLGSHMDSVAIAEWDGGRMRAICSGFGHVVDARGRVVLRLGEGLVPHGQEVRVADFLPESPGPEMAIRWNGHAPDVIVVTRTGKVAHRFRLNDSPNHTGMEAVFWHGPDGPAILYNGGMLWTGRGEPLAALPGLPEPIGPSRMGWYHAIPANVCGDAREDVVVYNPWTAAIWIYTPAPFERAAFGGYVPTARQCNVRLMD